MCLCFFGLYLWYMVRHADLELVAEKAKKAAIENKVISLSYAFYDELRQAAADTGDEEAVLDHGSDRFRDFLLKFYNRYDSDRDGHNSSSFRLSLIPSATD
eukprot:m.621065 g.621065  ORF g.621065 m.621065 type:complete len:101 (+) comp58210_c0_seq23:761-1063(+)